MDIEERLNLVLAAHSHAILGDEEGSDELLRQAIGPMGANYIPVQAGLALSYERIQEKEDMSEYMRNMALKQLHFMSNLVTSYFQKLERMN